MEAIKNASLTGRGRGAAPFARSGRIIDIVAAVLLACFALVFLFHALVLPALNRSLLGDVEGNLATLRAGARFAAGSGARGLASVLDLYAPGPAGPVPARLYRPKAAPGAALPLVVYFHGGGFVLGGIAQSDRFLAALARETEACVLSVEYGLAPERPYPGGLEDCRAAYLHALGNAREWGIDDARVVIAGDSAGGNLAAALAQRLRDEGAPAPRAQILLSMSAGHRDDGSPFPSRALFSRSSILTPPALESFGRLYLGDPASRKDDPYAFPLRARDFSRLPEALVVTCGKDPLRDEGEAYAARLKAAGTRVIAERFEGRDHDYLGPPVRRLIASFIRWL